MDRFRRLLEAYRWLWNAQKRWRPHPIWIAVPLFGLRVLVDVGRALLPPLEAPLMSAPFSGRPLVGAFAPVAVLGLVIVLALGVVSIDVATREGARQRVEAPPVIITASRLRVADIDPTPWEFTGSAADLERAGGVGGLMDDWLATLSPEEATRVLERWDANPRRGFMIVTSPPGESPVRAARVSMNGRLPAPATWPRIVNPNEVVQAVEKHYPATRDGVRMEGTVGMQWLVDADGGVLRWRVVQPSRYPELDRAAREVAAVYRFTPAEHDGRNVAAWVTGPVSFRLVD